MDREDTYESPLGHRYASKEMSSLFSQRSKYLAWRKLWISLAKAEKKLGLPITQGQIDEMEQRQNDLDLALAEKYEKELHHDVMAHVRAYGDQCPTAKPIIHLGSTSAFVTDNGDLLQQRDALQLLHKKISKLIQVLAAFAQKYASLPCVGFTHFQTAQPTTVGKRACLWIQDFLLDLYEIEHRLERLRFLGAKGATGTQASYLELFQGDSAKVKELDRLIGESFGFSQIFTISGQTYTRKQDILIVDVLCGTAASTHKMANDIRLLAHLQEVEEPFEKKQVGSSAMPYKRNPILSERICALSRYVISLGDNPRYTAAVQWLERSLDDSANRRLTIPEAFLATDAIIDLSTHLADNLVVYPGVIQKRLNEELPFLSTEAILMQAVKKGGDRQVVHEVLKEHTQAARQKLKESGETVSLLEQLGNDPRIPLDQKELKELIQGHAFVGRAPDQVHEFLEEEVFPALGK